MYLLSRSKLKKMLDRRTENDVFSSVSSRDAGTMPLMHRSNAALLSTPSSATDTSVPHTC